MSSCAACAVPAAPPSADRRHPHVQLRCCSAYRRASSLEPTRRQRARAEPRARRSLIVPPSTSSTCADRVVVRCVRAVPAAPPSADRRHPHVQLRCCSAYRRASSLEPTRRQRARAEPRARRSLIALPSTSSTCADRVVVRRVRRPGRTAERRPTPSSRSASLLLCLSPRQLTRANTTTASPRRAASTSFFDRAAVDLVDVRRSCRRAPRAPSRPHRRAPTDVILTFSFVAALPIAAPAHSSQHDDSEPAPSREHVVLLSRRLRPRRRAPIVSSCAACAVPAAPPSADRRHPHVQLRCCSAYRRASSPEPTRRQRARAEPRARRSLIALPSTSSTCADHVVVRRVRRPGRPAERRPTSSSRSASLLLCLSPRQLTRANTTTASPRRAASASFFDRAAVHLVDVRRSCRRAPRAPSRPHRRAPTDVILTFSFVAALPIAAPAHSSQHDDSEPAPSREHVVL